MTPGREGSGTVDAALLARVRRATFGRAGGAWRRFTRRRGRDAALLRLREDEDPAIAAVGRALSAAASPPDAAERFWVERIEALREQLGRSEEVLRTRPSGSARGPGRASRGTTVSRLALEVSKPARWGRVLLNLNRELRPRTSLELGTCIGLSTAYQAAGLELAGRGRVLTVEYAEPRVELARANLRRLGLSERATAHQGRFGATLGELFGEAEELGFAFVDGHHRRAATLRYFDRIAAHLTRPGVVLFDDITWSRGMRRAWAELSVDPRVSLAADLHGLGLCVVGSRGPRVPHRLDVFLHP